MKQDLCIMKRSLIWQKHCGLNASSEPRILEIVFKWYRFQTISKI